MEGFFGQGRAACVSWVLSDHYVDLHALQSCTIERSDMNVVNIFAFVYWPDIKKLCQRFYTICGLFRR